MPTSFRSIVRNKAQQGFFDEENLERGRVWMFAETNVRTKLYQCVCWIAPCCGCVMMEVWGAGGSGARMSCCGGGIPGNAGAYARKCFCVRAGCYIQGLMGFSCGNTASACFRGCSEQTGACWFGNGTQGCICSQGGRGGTSYCTTGTSLFCCFFQGNFCGTLINSNCGVICNFGSGTASCCAQAYGGDVNCFGQFSCAGFYGCVPNCVCSQVYFVNGPAGYFGTEGVVLQFGTENDNEFSNWSGQGHMQYIHALNTASRQPAQGIPTESKCWTGGRSCGCYEAQGCVNWFPPGFPGMAPSPCVNVCDVATRGGHGAIRIRFIASDA
jgi:hypothetical protein